MPQVQRVRAAGRHLWPPGSLGRVGRPVAREAAVDALVDLKRIRGELAAQGVPLLKCAGIAAPPAFQHPQGSLALRRGPALLKPSSRAEVWTDPAERPERESQKRCPVRDAKTQLVSGGAVVDRSGRGPPWSVRVGHRLPEEGHGPDPGPRVAQHAGRDGRPIPLRCPKFPTRLVHILSSGLGGLKGGHFPGLPPVASASFGRSSRGRTPVMWSDRHVRPSGGNHGYSSESGSNSSRRPTRLTK